MDLDKIQLIIPMSGAGQRFVDAGYTRPKPLIEVDGSPIIEHVLKMFPGVVDVTFICNKDHLRDTDMENLLTLLCPSARILSIDPHKKGPVYTVAQVLDHLSDSKETIVSYCDFGTLWDFTGFLEELDSTKASGGIPCYRGFHPHMLGSDNYAFCREEGGNLLEIKEKEPFTNDRMAEFASNGIYHFSSGALVKKYFRQLIDLDINLKGEYYISLVYNLMVRDGLKVKIFEIEKMLQWGTPYDLEIYKGWSRYFNSRAQQPPPPENPPGTVLVLPAAGAGARFKKEGFTIPKPILPVDDLPMVARASLPLPRCDNNVFIFQKVHSKDESLCSVISDNFPESTIIHLDHTTEGYACTCKVGIDGINLDAESPLMVSPCDNGVTYDVEEYSNLVNNDDIDIIAWSFTNNPTSKHNPNMYSWLEVDPNNFIHHVSCKDFIYENPLESQALIGTMFFRKARFFLDGLAQNIKENVRTNGEFCVDSILNQNIKAGLKVKAFPVSNYICWGTPQDYRTYIYWADFFNKQETHEL